VSTALIAIRPKTGGLDIQHDEGQIRQRTLADLARDLRCHQVEIN